MSVFRQDVVHAVRAVGRRPGLAGVAIATMAIAIAGGEARYRDDAASLRQS